MPKILCASNIEDIKKRMDPRVFVLSGLIGNELSSYEELPVISAIKDIEKLTDLVEITAKDWRPYDKY